MKVSIIVGIYNVSRFLKEKQFSCIMNQTYKDWELILVDDGSTDDSGRLCDEFEQQDSRIKVVHKENGGLGSARNAGLDVAQGDYIWFYDVDDEANINLLEYCVGEMEKKQLDMIQFGFKAITIAQHMEEDVHLHECMIEGQQQLREHYIDDILFVRYGNGFSCNKMISSRFIEKNHLRYEDQPIQQDEVFNLKAYPLMERLYLSGEVLYDYYIYDKGNNRSRFIPNRFDTYVSIREQFEQLRKVWNIDDKRFEEYLQNRFWGNVDQTLRYNLLHPDCPWSRLEKKKEMSRVMQHKYTLNAIDYNKPKMSFESIIYLYAYKQNNLFMLRLFTNIYSFFRKTKKALSL